MEGGREEAPGRWSELRVVLERGEEEGGLKGEAAVLLVLVVRDHVTS